MAWLVQLWPILAAALGAAAVWVARMLGRKEGAVTERARQVDAAREAAARDGAIDAETQTKVAQAQAETRAALNKGPTREDVKALLERINKRKGWVRLGPLLFLVCLCALLWVILFGLVGDACAGPVETATQPPPDALTDLEAELYRAAILLEGDLKTCQAVRDGLKLKLSIRTATMTLPPAPVDVPAPAMDWSTPAGAGLAGLGAGVAAVGLGLPVAEQRSAAGITGAVVAGVGLLLLLFGG